MEPLTSDCIMASTTPLIDPLTLLSRDDNRHIYFVLTNAEITHFLRCSHFTRLPFVTCLLVLVIGLEELMLDICNLEPMHWVERLSKGRFEKALEVYQLRGYAKSAEGKVYLDRIGSPAS